MFTKCSARLKVGRGHFQNLFKLVITAYYTLQTVHVYSIKKSAVSIRRFCFKKCKQNLNAIKTILKVVFIGARYGWWHYRIIDKMLLHSYVQIKSPNSDNFFPKLQTSKCGVPQGHSYSLYFLYHTYMIFLKQ
jgi:hypothetical protein